MTKGGRTRKSRTKGGSTRAGERLRTQIHKYIFKNKRTGREGLPNTREDKATPKEEKWKRGNYP